nr:MAG TPA: tail protein [Bacteriophage sp.]
MITDYQSNAYRISYQGVSMIENALENPNLIQVGVVPGCTIMVAPQKSYGIDYLPNGEYRSWTLTGYNTRLNRTEAHYIYARLERDSDDAMVLFSVNDYATDGSIGGENPSEDFYYIRIGSITATDSLEAATLDREITLDYGKLSTPEGQTQDTAGWKELFEVTADDLIRPLKRFTSYIVQGTLSIIGKLVINDKQITDVARQGDEGDFLQSDESVPTTKLLTGKYLDLLRQYLINKDREDSTKFLLTMMAGIVVGEKGFAEGLTGFGAKIDKKGYGEMRGLRLWEFLEVPELRYNRVEIFLGIKWRVPGAGIILSCTPDTDSEGNQLTTGTCTLKLEEGEFGAVSKDDIALGIFHFGDERDATEDSDDSKGNFKFSGFATTYFRVTEVSGDNNETFRYALRPGYTIHPQPQMNFSCYGNFTDEARQSSAYETRTYTRLLWKQNDWEFTVGNIAMQYGDLTNLNIFGLNMSGYSMYLNSVYFTGTINQVRPDGTPVLVANDRGQWESGTKYEFYDRVSHDGILWLCVAEDGTDTEPSKENADWLLQVDKGEDGAGLTYIGRWESGMEVPEMGVVTMCGSSFSAKNATNNPPLWCWTDNDGNRFIFEDGGYILTGEQNSLEYEIIAQKGEDGPYTEEIYTRTTINSTPSTPTTAQIDDYIPSGWTRSPSGISVSYPYEWVSKRRKSTDGEWGLFSTPAVFAQLGEKGADGLQGCVIRGSEWALNTEYRNDSDVKDGSLPVRYIDVALVRNNAMETGWDAYQCLKTHVSSSSITYANTEYWKKFGANVGSIFTSLIIAKNAKIQLFQGNDLLIQKNDGTVTAGMTGSNQGSLVRIFAGSTYENRASAPFRVTESGELYATKAHIQGEIVATSGSFSGELKGATGTFTGSLTAGDANGERIIIDSGAKSIELISGDLLLSYWEFFNHNGFKSCKLALLDNDYESVVIYPHEIGISRVDLSAKLTPSSLTISSGSITTSIGSNRIYMSDGSNSYIGFTGTAEYVPPNGYSKTLYFKNGICYKIG